MAFNALSPSVATKRGEVMYDLLHNYYLEYTCNQYFAKNFLDHSISNTTRKKMSTGGRDNFAEFFVRHAPLIK